MKQSRYEEVLQFIEDLRGKSIRELLNVPISTSEESAKKTFDKEDELDKGGAKYIMTEIFTKGNGGNFALVLSKAFPEGEMLLGDNTYVVVKIDDVLFDIRGDVTDIWEKRTKEENIEWKTVSAEYMRKNDTTNNYSFISRGPII